MSFLRSSFPSDFFLLIYRFCYAQLLFNVVSSAPKGGHTIQRLHGTRLQALSWPIIGVYNNPSIFNCYALVFPRFSVNMCWQCLGLIMTSHTLDISFLSLSSVQMLRECRLFHISQFASICLYFRPTRISYYPILS